jgi:hypothetical protein
MTSNSENGGNGHEKPFILAPVKSPEQVALENNKKIAPQIRRAVRGMRMRMQAKFLFDAILDDTFMYDFGGNGHGCMWASIKELAKRYHHDEDSIKKWSSVLIDKEVLWCSRTWPWAEWRITAICPAPDVRASKAQQAKARASAKKLSGDPTEGVGSDFFLPKNAKSPSKTDGIGSQQPKGSDRETEGIGSQNRRDRIAKPKVSVQNGGQDRFHDPKGSVSRSDTSRLPDPKGSDPKTDAIGSGPQFQPVKTGRSALLETSPELETLEKEDPLSCLTAEPAGATVAPEVNPFSGSTALTLRKKSGERGFLMELTKAFAAFDPKKAELEMVNWGGWWRNRFRENPGKCWRVVAEIVEMVKDGKVQSNPGAAAKDLWERFA